MTGMRYILVAMLSVSMAGCAISSGFRAKEITRRYVLQVSSDPLQDGEFSLNVYLNDRLVGTFRHAKQERELTPLLKRGRNRLRVAGEVIETSEKPVQVTLGVVRDGKFVSILVYAMSMTSKGKKDRTFTFSAD